MSLEEETMSLEEELECAMKRAKILTTELLELARANQQSKFDLVEKNMEDIQDYFDSCSHFDCIVQIVEGNANYYDQYIILLKQQIQLQNMTNGEEKDELEKEIKHKKACYQLTNDYCATDEKIHDFVYGEQRRLERALPNQIQSIFNNLTTLYDLRKSDVIDKCISDLYLFVRQQQPFIEHTKDFLDLYYTHYTIPECILDTTEIIRAIKDETTIIQDNICDIMSFLNDGTLSKYQLDELVYNTV